MDTLSLFGNEIQIVDTINALPSDSPLRQLYGWETPSGESGAEIVGEFAQLMISSGKATNLEQAIRCLEEIGRGGKGRGVISLKDLKPLAVNTYLTRLKKHCPETKSQANWRIHGQIGHGFMHRLWRRDLPIGLNDDGRSACLPMFEGHDTSQMPQQLRLFEVKARSYFDAFDSQGHLRSSYINLLADMYEHLRKSISYAPGLELFDTLEELRALMKPLFNGVLDRIRGCGVDSCFIELITLTSWLGMVLQCYNAPGPRVFFPEIRAFDLRRGFSGGRIDAIEIDLIGETPPSASQLHCLRAASDTRFISVGHLLRQVSDYFGQPIAAKIYDWKFAVGDHPGKDQVISKPSVPFPKHTAQVVRYLCLSHYDEGLARGITSHDEIWARQSSVDCGTLVYSLPSGVFEHSLVTHEEKREAYQSQIGQHLDRAEMRLAVRQLMGAWISYVNGNTPVIRQSTPVNVSSLLFGEVGAKLQPAPPKETKSGARPRTLRAKNSKAMLSQQSLLNG